MGNDTFRLSKWYLDCVTENGEPFVGYAADLAWGPVSLHYAGMVGGPATFRPQPAPSWCGGDLEWNAPALDVKGRWQALGAPFREDFLAGAVDWRCVAPRARVLVTAGDRTFQGLGYAELIVLTATPWTLPMRELRWGRFLSESDTLVWIECAGPCPEHAVWRNGVRCDEVPALKMESTRVLRDGALGDTILSTFPRVRRLFPKRILSVRETKWLSRASLGDDTGWALYERVRWP